MKIIVLFFASVADKAGTSRWTTSLSDGSTIEDVKKILVENFPNITDILPICHVAVNREYVLANQVLNTSDEIAFFPPVSGG
ncbi:molybdopterin converting factor subunit 1 [Alteribacillus sp. JSM 102045]|uniref:molybdopterin converting factor subunit 1 n=1 Tax=Alteribacillus sp. JSM 102045 TaxID=1562101 RepID=UPI0035BEC535